MAGARFDLDYAELRNGVRRSGVTGAIQHYLRAMTDLLRDQTPIMREIGEELVSSTKDRFDKQRGPDGRPWAPNSPVTRARKRNPRILIESGMLKDSIRYHADRRRVSVGSNRVYAAMQQFGGTKARFSHLWGDIPARPFIGMSQRDKERVNDIILQYLGRV